MLFSVCYGDIIFRAEELMETYQEMSKFRIMWVLWLELTPSHTF